MGNREQKQFHHENRTHVTKREYSGAEISIDNSANAPMDLKIFANSFQEVTKQGKNLYDMDKGFDSVISSLAHTPAYKCDKKKVSKTEWLFDNMAQSNKICYFVMPFKTKKNTNYVLSLTVNQYKIGGPIGIANNTTSDTIANQWNVVGGRDWYTYVPNAKTDTRISFKFNSGNYETLYFRGYFNYAATAESYCIFKDIQLEEGTALTKYEPFVPDSPSNEYPSIIYPLGEMLLKCSNGIEANSTKIPFVGYAMEVSDFEKSNFTFDGKYYLCDYIEYDSANNKAFRYKYIDETLLDYTILLKDQTQAILKEPVIEELIPFNDEYVFSDVKSIQGGCKISTKSYSEEDLPKVYPLCLGANVKLIK